MLDGLFLKRVHGPAAFAMDCFYFCEFLLVTYSGSCGEKVADFTQGMLVFAPPLRHVYSLVTKNSYLYFIYFRGHLAAVLCVQFDEEKIVSGSSDRSIKVMIMFLFLRLFPGVHCFPAFLSAYFTPVNRGS